MEESDSRRRIGQEKYSLARADALTQRKEQFIRKQDREFITANTTESVNPARSNEERKLQS
jgi:hypothetical protein